MASFVTLPDREPVRIIHGSAGHPFRVGLVGGGAGGQRLTVRLSHPNVGTLAEQPPRGGVRAFLFTPRSAGQVRIEAVRAADGHTLVAAAAVVVRTDSSLPGVTPTDDDLTLDLVSLGLDVAGVLDPTGLADTASAGVSVYQGDYAGAAMSIAGVIPLLGDIAKTGKLGKHAATVVKVVQKAAKDEKYAKAVRPLLEQISKRFDDLPLDSLPAGMRKELNAIKGKIDEFLGAAKAGRRKYKPHTKHEGHGGSMGRKGARMDLTEAQADELLNSASHCRQVGDKRQFVGVKDGKVYAFQDANDGTFHGYQITGNELGGKYSQVQGWVAELLGTTVTRLQNMK